jgi:ubiquinone/menaquinone biosynthesis C-methylase UbiE
MLKLMDGNQLEVWDYVDLVLLRLAKIGRRKLEDTETLEHFYNDFFNDNDVQVRSAGGDLRRHYQGEILRTAAWSRMPMDATVIDVGCGIGDNLRYILRDNARFFGVEYAEETARLAQRLLGNQAHVQSASAMAIPFPDQHFDLALCIEVLEHVEDDEKALSETARILRSGGSLILSLPYRHWFPSYYRLMGHIRHYTRTDVESMLVRHGLVIAEYLPNFPRWSRFANYCYVVSRMYTYVLRTFGIRRSPVEVCLPFSRERLIDKLFSWVEPIRQREMRSNYSMLETSTFVVALKP